MSKKSSTFVADFAQTSTSFATLAQLVEQRIRNA